ncbi:hypothetical protein BCR43DRAFT_128209 [Syncephalastrum racemosum]|uniref:Zn(2)-C6 fungal-type domain-containing protein n=1 Tax=Syncephalastrum racemosum TaxID=13706 RepID=A0A1X2HL59_SYNRA|nr:hypothetical protein BCR43DRAFT_128209 [Syncephalastrum racemosum]
MSNYPSPPSTDTESLSSPPSTSPPAVKRRRQRPGYACDSCRTRQIGCNRGHPTCDQCDQRRIKCVYSNDTYGRENSSRMQELQTQIQQLWSELSDLEHEKNQLLVTRKNKSPSLPPPATACLVSWAAKHGWPTHVVDGLYSIHTNITTLHDLRVFLVRALCHLHTTHMPFSPFDQPHLRPDPTDAGALCAFKCLGRFESPTKSSSQHGPCGTTQQTPRLDELMSMDIVRLLAGYEECFLPLSDHPSLLVQRYCANTLPQALLFAILAHALPHAAVYHPHLLPPHWSITKAKAAAQVLCERADLDDFEPTLIGIHHRLYLTLYHLDVGRVQRAFIQLGLLIRHCFALNLHLPNTLRTWPVEERKLAIHLFWNVWYIDSLVPLFYGQPSVMREHEIASCPLERDDPLAQMIVARQLLLAHPIADDLHAFYRLLPRKAKFETVVCHPSSPSSIWASRALHGVLLDYCQAWITFFKTEDNTPPPHVTQAAVAIMYICETWCTQPRYGFDCFFRSFLFHFISAVHVFKDNSLATASKTALVRMLTFYKTTPTFNSFGESALAKQIESTMTEYNIQADACDPQHLIQAGLGPEESPRWLLFRERGA